jgi:hypothetical protein
MVDFATETRSQPMAFNGGVDRRQLAAQVLSGGNIREKKF